MKTNFYRGFGCRNLSPKDPDSWRKIYERLDEEPDQPECFRCRAEMVLDGNEIFYCSECGNTFIPSDPDEFRRRDL